MNEPNECGGYYCSEEHGHIDCRAQHEEEQTHRFWLLLTAVLDAGRPHSAACDCDQCNAWLAVRKELRPI